MTRISDDTEVALHILRDYYTRVRAKHPDNELLKLAELHHVEGTFTFTKDYRRRFVGDTDIRDIQGITRYTFALRDVLAD